MKNESLVSPERITLELRNLKVFMRSDVSVRHIIEIKVTVVLLGVAILLIPFLQWLFGR